MQTHRTELSEDQTEELTPKHYYGDQGADQWKDLVQLSEVILLTTIGISHLVKQIRFGFATKIYSQTHCFLIMLCNLGSNDYLQFAVTKQPDHRRCFSNIRRQEKKRFL